MNCDKIKIENLEIYAYHGAYSEETSLGQRFFVSAVLYTDTRKAGETDDLAASTNYGTVCCFINDYLRKHTFRLLEAAAENLARELLLAFPLISSLDLEIRKPSAPIPLPFESVSVEVSRGWREAYVAFGSNMGDCEALIGRALEEIRRHPMCRVEKVSEMFRSTPYGGVEQDDFVNGALLLETLYPPDELLTFLHGLEDEAGRIRTRRWGPRTLDLDILFYGDEIVNTQRLVIPHPDMQNRDFVLVPLMQLNPGKLHPVLGKRVYELWEELEKGNERHIVL